MSLAAGKAPGTEVPQEVASDATLEIVAHLLEAIPRDLCAHAAFHCGAHARALQYYETHVRAAQRGAVNQAGRRGLPDPYTDEQVTFLQVCQTTHFPDPLFICLLVTSVHAVLCCGALIQAGLNEMLPSDGPALDDTNSQRKLSKKKAINTTMKVAK